MFAAINFGEEAADDNHSHQGLKTGLVVSKRLIEAHICSNDQIMTDTNDQITDSMLKSCA